MNKFKYLKNQSNEQYNINKHFLSTMKIAAKLLKVGYFFNTVCKNVNLIFVSVYIIFLMRTFLLSHFLLFIIHIVFLKSNI